MKQENETYYCSRTWLNAADSPSTGSIVCYDGVKDWDRWHGAHLQATSGQCPYTSECPIHARSVEKALNNPKKPLQLSLF